jgi:putative transposase
MGDDGAGQPRSVRGERPGTTRPRFSPCDRAFLAALLHRLPHGLLGRIRPLVHPTRCSLAPRPAGPPSRGQIPPRAPRPTADCAVHPATGTAPGRENPSWGYRHIHGELLVLGIKTAASTVWEILRQADIDPAPDRATATWASFLRSQADALLACDFLETVTLAG